MGKINLNKKQKILMGIGLLILILIILCVAYSKKVQALEFEKINQYISSYNEEVDNYILDEYEEEYNSLIEDINIQLDNKKLEKAKNDKSLLEDLKDNIINKNKEMYNEGMAEIDGIDLSELSEDKKQEINKKKDEIQSFSDENNYKSALSEIGKLKEYISNSIDELKKQKEEEKKQKEEEQKKNSERQEVKEEKEQVSKNSNNTGNQGSYVSQLKIAQETDQLLIVKGQGGSDAVVEFHVKDGNGVWTQVFSTSAYVGQGGITYNKREGDKATPAGVYSFGTAFGIAGNPGANISYRVVTNNDYWVDDSNSKYYNRWVTGDTPDKDWNSAEHMINFQAAYKYGIVINYNTYNTVKGKGSGIFIHCKTVPTPGCIGIPDSYMVSLLRQINSSARIVISSSEGGIYNY